RDDRDDPAHEAQGEAHHAAHAEEHSLPERRRRSSLREQIRQLLLGSRSGVCGLVWLNDHGFFSSVRTRIPCPTPAGSFERASWNAIRAPSGLTTGFE